MAQMDIGKVIDLAGAIKGVLHEEAAKPSTSLEQSDVNKVTQQVTDAVKKEVNPVLTNALNQEPWYQSRIILGLVVTIGLQIVSAAGVRTDTIDPVSTTNLLVQLGSLAGAILAYYGRVKSGLKPLGE